MSLTNYYFSILGKQILHDENKHHLGLIMFSHEQRNLLAFKRINGEWIWEERKIATVVVPSNVAGIQHLIIQYF